MGTLNCTYVIVNDISCFRFLVLISFCWSCEKYDYWLFALHEKDKGKVDSKLFLQILNSNVLDDVSKIIQGLGGQREVTRTVAVQSPEVKTIHLPHKKNTKFSECDDNLLTPE